MTDRIVMLGCVALLVVSVFADTRGAGQVTADRTGEQPGASIQSGTGTGPASAPTLDLPAIYARCVNAALDHLEGRRSDPPSGVDLPAFYFTNPHTGQELPIYCDSVPAVVVVSLERRFMP